MTVAGAAKEEEEVSDLHHSRCYLCAGALYMQRIYRHVLYIPYDAEW